MKIIQIQKIKHFKDDVVSVCITDMATHHNNTFNCKVEHVGDIIKYNLD